MEYVIQNPGKTPVKDQYGNPFIGTHLMDFL